MALKSIHRKAVALLLLLCLSLAVSCTPAFDHPVGSDSESPSSAETPAEAPEETPAETPVETPVETGSLGQPEVSYPGDPEKEEPPANPEKSLLEKSKEKYGVEKNNIGCKSITVLSRYNKGVEYDLTPIKDSTNKIFYICLPGRADLSAVTFKAEHYDGTVSGPYTVDLSDDELTDDERVIESTDVFVLKGMISNRPSLMLQINEAYGTVDKMNRSSNHSVYAYGDMLITMPEDLARANGWTTRYESEDADPHKHCSMEMRGRGNATWGYRKKSYQFELEKDMDLLGLGRSDTFVLLANYNDASFMRNQVALWLGQQIGADFTSKFCQVDFYLNGVYMGIYMLTEKCDIGPNRIEIDKNLDYLYEVNQKYQEYGEYGFLSPNDIYGKIRLHNEVENVAHAKEIFYAADSAAYGRDEEEFLKWFDLESWAKAYIVQQYAMNQDAYRGSFYFYYSHEDGKLHACTPWDFDYAMGVSSGTNATSKNRVEDPRGFDVSVYYLIEGMIRFDSFKRAVIDVYYNGGAKEAVERIPDMVRQWAEENRLSAEMNHAAVPTRLYPDYEGSNYTIPVLGYDDAVDYLLWILEPRTEWFESLIQSYMKETGTVAG